MQHSSTPDLRGAKQQKPGSRFADSILAAFAAIACDSIYLVSALTVSIEFVISQSAYSVDNSNPLAVHSFYYGYVSEP